MALYYLCWLLVLYLCGMISSAAKVCSCVCCFAVRGVCYKISKYVLVIKMDHNKSVKCFDFMGTKDVERKPGFDC